MVKKQETKVSTIENEDIDLLSRADACRFLHVSQSMLDAHLSILKVQIGRKLFT